MSEAARRHVALACRVLADNGLDDKIWGHVSIRDAQDRGVWLKRAKIGLGFILALIVAPSGRAARSW